MRSCGFSVAVSMRAGGQGEAMSPHAGVGRCDVIEFILKAQENGSKP
jgi:hypothetical protein